MENQTQWLTQTLSRWIDFAREDFYELPDPNMLCYGMGYDHWAVQTQQKAFSAVAMVGLTTNNTELIETALRMLRFNLQTHIEGSICCLDGRKWGHTWISALGVERMMHAVYPLMPYMTGDEKALLRKVLISESDWLLENYPVVAHPENQSGMNKPESNAWNGAILFRTAKMYPDAPNAAAYLEKAELFFANTISILADRGKPGVVDGNFFDSYALNHHGYLNIGYMVITLSQLAFVHFFCKEFGHEPPRNLYNHVEDLWQLTKSCIAPDGRLMRIGGDSRLRYCYCQDYAIPMWLFIRDYLGDPDCDKMLAGWLSQVDREVKANGDGSFLSDRCGNLRRKSLLYYTRLESDRATVLSMALAWLPQTEREKTVPALESWQDDFHGSAFVRSEAAFRSFSWLGCDGPMGLCVPTSDSSMAEWEMNLAPEVLDNGAWHQWEILGHKEAMFPGGFLTCGSANAFGRIYVAESQVKELVGTAQIAAAALPDGAGMLVLQKFSLPSYARTILSRIQGVNLKIPNDLYNGNCRAYTAQLGDFRLESRSGEALIPMGSWANADDKLGVYLPGDALKLYRPAKRETTINIMHADRNTGADLAHLYCDILVGPFSREYRDLRGGSVVVNTGFAVSAGTAAQTQAMEAPQPALPESGGLRGVCARGRDGKQYLLLANFGAEAETVLLSAGECLAQTGEVSQNNGWHLQPGASCLLCL